MQKIRKKIIYHRDKSVLEARATTLDPSKKLTMIANKNNNNNNNNKGNKAKGDATEREIQIVFRLNHRSYQLA